MLFVYKINIILSDNFELVKDTFKILFYYMIYYIKFYYEMFSWAKNLNITYVYVYVYACVKLEERIRSEII